MLGVAPAHTEPSRIGVCTHATTPAVKCLDLPVYENREQRIGRRIIIHVVVVSAERHSASRLPVFFFAGGPGQAAAAGALDYYKDPLQMTLHRNHDLVFIDQRGTGESNGLYCDLYRKTAPQSYFGPIYSAEAVNSCLHQTAAHADLRYYFTRLAVEDANDVRKWLGYSRVILIAGSYGTTVALDFMRQYPDNVSRAVLDGVAPPNFHIPLSYVRAEEHSLNRLFLDCAADAVCHKRFPSPRSDLAIILKRFDRGPIHFSYKESANKPPVEIALYKEAFVERLRNMLYDATIQSAMPLLLRKMADGNFQEFASIAELFVRAVDSQIAVGDYFSVTCSEDLPFISESAITREASGTIAGTLRVRAHQRVCSKWPAGKVPATFDKPFYSAVTTLMLSGALDPATPPNESAMLKRYLRNGVRIVFPNASHLGSNACSRNMTLTFIEKGRLNPRDTYCVGRIERPPFLMTLPPDFLR